VGVKPLIAQHSASIGIDGQPRQPVRNCFDFKYPVVCGPPCGGDDIVACLLGTVGRVADPGEGVDARARDDDVVVDVAVGLQFLAGVVGEDVVGGNIPLLRVS